MSTRRFALLSILVGIALLAIGCGGASATPEAPATQADVTTIPDDLIQDLPVALNPDDLRPCGDFDKLRLLEAPPPVPTPDSPPTTAPTQADPEDSNANSLSLRPAPTEDRVGFPENYATDFKLLAVFDRPDRRLARAICGNDIAAGRKPGEPYEYGSVLLMISYAAKLDAKGQPVLDENGHYIRTNFVAYHVMRKEKGFGEAYGSDRSGEWEYVGYKADGKTYETRPENSNACSACHVDASSEAVDYVFRTNMMTGDESSVESPPVGENEISIYLYGFHMTPITIKAGTTITWVNNDQAKHTIMAAIRDPQGNVISDPNALFASSILPSVAINPNSSFSFTFDQPGEYLYMCTIHKNMVGRIIVSE